jgi:hypothetical protein
MNGTHTPAGFASAASSRAARHCAAAIALYACVLAPQASFAQQQPQQSWAVTLTPTMNPLPIGFCAAIHLTLFDPVSKDVPRNPLGYRVTIADFDITLSTPDGTSAAVQYLGASNVSSCACQGSAIGTVVTVTATYPAQALSAAARVPNVAFQRTATFVLAEKKGPVNPPPCGAVTGSVSPRGAPAPAAQPPAVSAALPADTPATAAAAVASPPTAPPVTAAAPPAAPPVSVASPTAAPAVIVASPPAAPAVTAGSPPAAPAVTAGSPPAAPPVIVAEPPTAPPVSVVAPAPASTGPSPAVAMPPAGPSAPAPAPAPISAPTAAGTPSVALPVSGASPPLLSRSGMPVGIVPNPAPPLAVVDSVPPAGSRSTAPVPINPSGFMAVQIDSARVQLSWQPVIGASYYVLFGPGVANGGEKVSGATTFTATAVPTGSQQWAVGSFYEPGPTSTPATTFSRVTLNVTAPVPRLRLQPITATSIPSGSVFTVKVEAVDANNTVDPTFTGTVTLHASAGGGSDFTHGDTAPVIAGEATFSVFLNNAANDYILTASAPGLADGVSNSFHVTAHHLSFLTPVTGMQAGTPSGLTIEARDANDNVAENFTGVVSLSAAATGGTNFTTTPSASAVGGVATFSGLTLTSAANNYHITASAAGATSVTSASFNVTP